MLSGDSDLRRAVLAGLSLWAVEGLGCVELRGTVLRYDPMLTTVVRGKQVLAILREREAAARSQEK